MYLRHTTIARRTGRFIATGVLCAACGLAVVSSSKRWRSLASSMSGVALQARALARHLIGAPEQARLFDDGSEQLTVPVRLKGIRVERSRQFGDVYLALALWRGTGLDGSVRAAAAGRARSGRRGRRWRRCWWRRGCASRRASCTLPRIGTGARRFAICCSSTTRRSTRIGSIARSISCSRTRPALEAHLSQRCGELFAIENEVLLYDVTSTYFEGQAEANPLAQRGYSRDHRPDCKQVCIALVVTFDGFPLGYEVFAGNTHDSQDRADHRGHHGGPAWRARAGLDRRPRHGQRRQSGVAAPDRPALHHRRAEVGAEEVRR